MAELSIPVATIVGAEMTQHPIYETIKALRDSYMEFCEDEDEFITTVVPIENDPEPYANGTKKTRPILKKYAQALVDKLQLDQLEAEAQRDIHLTPQQVKADVKRYVSICEKKMAQQQEQCDALQKQVEQLRDVVKCIVTHPMFDSDFASDAFRDNQTGDSNPCLDKLRRQPISLLTFSIEKNMPNVQDFLLEQGLKCDGKVIAHCTREELLSTHRSYKEILLSSLHYACYKNDKICVEKMLATGSDINSRSILLKKNEKVDRKMLQMFVSVLEIAANNGSLEMVKFLHEKGAKIGDTQYHVPNGPEGDLVAGYLQTHGSKPVTRF